nr:ferredoxin [uncultured bacterium]
MLIAPQVFDQGEEDGVVVVLDAKPEGALLPVVGEAVELCPAQALALEG